MDGATGMWAVCVRHKETRTTKPFHESVYESVYESGRNPSESHTHLDIYAGHVNVYDVYS